MSEAWLGRLDYLVAAPRSASSMWLIDRRDIREVWWAGVFGPLGRLSGFNERLYYAEEPVEEVPSNSHICLPAGKEAFLSG